MARPAIQSAWSLVTFATTSQALSCDPTSYLRITSSTSRVTITAWAGSGDWISCLRWCLSRSALPGADFSLLRSASTWSIYLPMFINQYDKLSSVAITHLNLTGRRRIFFSARVQVLVWVRLLKDIRQRVSRTSMQNSLNRSLRSKSWQFFSIRACSSSEQNTMRSSASSGSEMLTIHTMYWWFLRIEWLRWRRMRHLPSWWWVATISLRSTVSTRPDTPAISNLVSPSLRLKFISMFWVRLSRICWPFSFRKAQSQSMASSDRYLLCSFQRWSISSFRLYSVGCSGQRAHLRRRESNMCLQVMWISFLTIQGSFLQLGQRLSLAAMYSQSEWQNMRSHLSHSRGQSRGMQQQTGQVTSSSLRNPLLLTHFSSMVMRSGSSVRRMLPHSTYSRSYICCDYKGERGVGYIV